MCAHALCVSSSGFCSWVEAELTPDWDSRVEWDKGAGKGEIIFSSGMSKRFHDPSVWIGQKDGHAMYPGEKWKRSLTVKVKQREEADNKNNLEAKPTSFKAAGPSMWARIWETKTKRINLVLVVHPVKPCWIEQGNWGRARNLGCAREEQGNLQ